jgi:hypothetical protein
MMDDFFDTLERQLVAATPNRAARIRRARLQRAAAVASVLAVLLAGGAGIAAAVGGGDGGDRVGAPAGRPAATTTTQAVPTPPNAPDPGTYTVAVLNGTAVPGLGRGVAMQLQNAGNKIGNVTNASRHDVTETTVYYRSNDCLPAASQVASTLRLGDQRGRFDLRKVTPELRAIAGKDADVVVVAGSDRNHPSGP